MKNIICFCFSIMLFCFGGYEQVTAEVKENISICSTLSVKGNQLVNEKGETVQLKGISTHGIAWFPEYINEQCFKELKQQWGIDVIRIAMYTAENGGYCTDGNKEYLKNLVKNGIEYATKYNMYVIIDWHILSDGNPNTYKEEAKEFFDEMSKTYGKQNNIIYEICNEPNGTTSWEDIKQYAQEIISVIRKNDANNIVLVGTPNWSQFIEQAAENPITNENNIMYTLHFYAATHKQDLRDNMQKAIEKGLPVFVSEFGICDASGNGAINEEQANEWIKMMNTYHISYVIWNLSNKAETSAILKSDCKKNNGFTNDNLSESGKWFYKMLTNKKVIQSQNINNSIQNINRNTNDLEISANVVQHWQQNGKEYYQYECTIKNNSTYAKNQWNITLQFDEAVTLVNAWNGNFNVIGNGISIYNMDYNANIQQGEYIKNIGFIVCSDRQIRIKY
ncbi:MAG: cellulase family glycosylhydrolase [Firmicutes bacterium]|nr:cellulase family glycosylhydrolase [Bacillota bacterium]